MKLKRRHNHGKRNKNFYVLICYLITSLMCHKVADYIREKRIIFVYMLYSVTKHSKKYQVKYILSSLHQHWTRLIPISTEMSQWLPWVLLFLLLESVLRGLLLSLAVKESERQVSGRPWSTVNRDKVGLLNNVLHKHEKAFNILYTLKLQVLCYTSYNEY
jgi:hypothetical protein